MVRFRRMAFGALLARSLPAINTGSASAKASIGSRVGPTKDFGSNEVHTAQTGEILPENKGLHSSHCIMFIGST